MAEWCVLVIDLDRDAARLHCRQLARQPGFTVVGVATSASQAAAMLGNLRPHLAQRDIDELTAASRPPHRWLPRDLDRERLEQVRCALASARRPLTAQQVGSATGVARTTARRYLEYLVTIDEATVETHCPGPGRPLKSYQRHDAPITGIARERRPAA